MKKIVVIGSSNMDIVVEAEKRAKAGETLIADRLFYSPGGKGGNQAVAAARAGANVYMIGSVGEDIFGQRLIENYKLAKVDCENIKKLTDTETGVAIITLAEGDNSILIVKGANDKVSKKDIDEVKELLSQSDLLILQNEIPVDTIKYAIDHCHESGIKILYNPAPFVEIERSYLDKVDFITPNEHEAKLLFGDKSKEELMKKYPNKLIITLGKDGVEFFDGKEIVNIPAFKVEALDTTGAGDTFNGAFASQISQGEDLYKAIKFANAAAALSVMKHGAQAGMPMKDEIETFLKERI